MSNQTESKSELILSATRELLINDNVSTSFNVDSIQEYCADRIQREDLMVKTQFPKIDLSCEEGISDIGIPTRIYFLTIKPRTHMDQDNPQTILERLSTRIGFLINNKPASLNAASVVAGKNLRCRVCFQESALRVPDTIERIYTKVISYRIICDDEIIN